MPGNISLSARAALIPDHPPFPYVAFEGATQNAIWLMGNLTESPSHGFWTITGFGD